MGMNAKALVRVARVFATGRGIKLSTVGKYAANHGAFFQRLEEGKTITEARRERVFQWLSDHWPEGCEWPSDTPRPEPASREEDPA